LASTPVTKSVLTLLEICRNVARESGQDKVITQKLTASYEVIFSDVHPGGRWEKSNILKLFTAHERQTTTKQSRMCKKHNIEEEQEQLAVQVHQPRAW